MLPSRNLNDELVMAGVLEILPVCVSLTAFEFRCVSTLASHLCFFPPLSFMREKNSPGLKSLMCM